MKITVGFDPGKDGGIAIIGDGFITVNALPFDGDELAMSTLVRFIGDHVRAGDTPLLVIEKVHSMPKQGVVSTFTFGSGFGELKALAKILGHPWELVPPQTWKKHVLFGTDKSKGGTVEWAIRTYPQLRDHLIKKSGLAHMGKVDALAIAHYGHHFAKR